MQSTSYFELYAPQSVALIIIMTGFYVNATKNRSHYNFFCSFEPSAPATGTSNLLEPSKLTQMFLR